MYYSMGLTISAQQKSRRAFREIMSKEIHPIKIKGNWEVGYALDVHTKSSQFIGYDDLGREMFDTERSRIGELLYRLKYRGDRTVVQEIVQLVLDFTTFETIDVIIPVPPSHTNRPFQPVIEIAVAIGSRLNITVLTNLVRKVKETPELKNVGNFEERKKILEGVFEVKPVGCLSDKTVLLFDDLYRSGATVSSLTAVLYDQGKATSVKVLTLTKTRSKS